MRVIAKGTGYVKGAGAGKRLNTHLKYIQHREYGPEETKESRALFGKEEDEIDRHQAHEEIMSHKMTSVNYHKIVLSPGEDEQVHDWKQWTRDTMADLEREKGRELHWVAVHHKNTDHEHVHVVLAGGGEDHEGKLRQIKMTVDDYRHMREHGREHSEYEFYQDMQKHMKNAEREEAFNRELYRKPTRAQEREPEREPERKPERETPKKEKERPGQERDRDDWER